MVTEKDKTNIYVEFVFNINKSLDISSTGHTVHLLLLLQGDHPAERTGLENVKPY